MEKSIQKSIKFASISRFAQVFFKTILATKVHFFDCHKVLDLTEHDPKNLTSWLLRTRKKFSSHIDKLRVCYVECVPNIADCNGKKKSESCYELLVKYRHKDWGYIPPPRQLNPEKHRLVTRRGWKNLNRFLHDSQYLQNFIRSRVNVVISLFFF